MEKGEKMMGNTVLDFQKDVLGTSKKIPVVVDFWAEWCGPCRILGPVLEKLAAEANGAWRLVKINTEEQQQIAIQFGIRSIPAVKMFSNGQVVAEFVGALPEVQVRNGWIRIFRQNPKNFSPKPKWHWKAVTKRKRNVCLKKSSLSINLIGKQKFNWRCLFLHRNPSAP